MKNIVYILILLANLTFGQTVKMTAPEIEKYTNSIDKFRAENRLVKISYPNMSGCGGGVDGYYLNKNLVLIDATYNAELGFSSRTIYVDKDRFLKVIYREHFAEWGKYEEKYPHDKFEYDPTKMTYTDTVYSITLTNPTIFYEKAGNKIINSKLDQSLLDRLLSCGQQMKLELQEVIKQIDSLKFVKEMPYICPGGIQDNKISSGCGDDIYWNVVTLNQNAIELLIDKLDDTTTTEAFIPMYSNYFKVADIALWALEEIIRDIPKYKLMGVKEDKSGEYETYEKPYWKFVNQGFKNRQKFKAAVKDWYHKNKSDLVWVKSNYFSSCDCGGKHPNGGHYKLKTGTK
jgi:hypothetical protein